MTSKVADVESALNSALTQCLLRDSTCFTNSGFTCSDDDSMVTFRYVNWHVGTTWSSCFYLELEVQGTFL